MSDLPEGAPGSRTTYTVEITAREKEACERFCESDYTADKLVTGDTSLITGVLKKIAALPPKFHVEQSDTPTTPTQT